MQFLGSEKRGLQQGQAPGFVFLVDDETLNDSFQQESHFCNVVPNLEDIKASSPRVSGTLAHNYMCHTSPYHVTMSAPHPYTHTLLVTTVKRVFFGRGYFSEILEKNPKITIFLNVSENLSNHWFHGTTAHVQTKQQGK